jgi:hypothetical protein
MVLKTKLAFEIWTGIVLLIIVIGGVAGVTLLLGNDVAPLIRTQANNPSASPLFSESDIQNASEDIGSLFQP